MDLALATDVLAHPTTEYVTAPLALEAIYRQHFAFVYRTAARLAGPGFDAEDIAQEVFLVVSRKLDTYDGRAAVTTWLCGITINVVRAARRRQRRRRLFERGGPDVDEPVRAPDSVEVDQARRIAYQILGQLGARHREVLILSEFQELSCDEIAAVVGCKTATVWSRLHYARKEFARRLEKRGLGGGGR